ncbi:MAG: AbrB/MazE/SpoVT family DNA-binding domain-containing protein [Ruminococcaceae bacterium]|nr:AbrB/MazE/SpoVT family DNA-binding domain-containing protein [Oscillospiraceae bacterium]
MKATGIVRRIDDLGRVVIPKEIRRTLRIREGDPLEIFTQADGEVIFKKYSPIGEFSEFSHQYTEVLSKATNMTVFICDRDHIISASGQNKRELTERRISEELERMMDDREIFIAKQNPSDFRPVMNNDWTAGVMYPIIGSGDVSGAVVLMLPDSGLPGPTDIKLAQVAASFLGKQTEE